MPLDTRRKTIWEVKVNKEEIRLSHRTVAREKLGHSRYIPYVDDLKHYYSDDKYQYRFTFLGIGMLPDIYKVPGSKARSTQFPRLCDKAYQ